MTEVKRMNPYSELRKMRILVVDDDDWIRDSMSLLLEGEGCSLAALETAEEGIGELEKRDYDMILCDYRLPGMDGLEFLKRTQVSHPRAMKILITAYGGEDVFSEAKRIGVQELIEKPFTAKILEEALVRLIEKKS
jgi:DNA-binding NtrC family response regulator